MGRVSDYPLAILLLALVVIETYAHIFLLPDAAVAATWMYLMAGVAISLIVMTKSPSSAIIELPQKFRMPWYLLGVLLIAVITLPQLIEVLRATPLDYRQADMLPIMKVMGERFLGGMDPYEPIAEIWEGMQPIYLPAMWLPYLPAIAFDFDLRWIGVLVLISGCLLPGLWSQHRRDLLPSLVALLPVGLLLYGLTMEDFAMLTLTEESLVVGFYLLLATAIYRDSLPLMIIGLTLCMMSRYSLVIWAVMWVVLIFFYEDKGRGLRLALISAACALVLLIVTRGIAYLDVFLSLSGAYLEDIQSADHRWKMEPVVKNSLGLAKFFAYENLPQLHQWFFAGLIGLPALLLAIFAKYKAKLDRRFFLLGSLKLCLVGFYNLLIYPLSYLFYTSTFLSAALLYYFLVDSLRGDSKELR